MNKKSEDTINHTTVNRKLSGKTTATSIATLGIIAILITAFLFAPLTQPTGAPLPPPPPLPGPGTFFELGPLVSPPTTPGQATNILCDVSGNVDWGFSVANNCGLFKFNQVAPIGAGGGIAATFEGDTVSASSFIDFTTYSGGGLSNKNNDPISIADCAARTPPLTGSACNEWVWDGGNVPAKDDLSNTYTFAKLAPNGDLILYGGFERISPGGDSHIDLEYFHSSVNITGIPNFTPKSGNCADTFPNGTLIQPVPSEPCHWQGIRTVGDIILSTDFTVGGSFGGITARDWTGNTYSPTLVSVNNTEGCNGAGFTGHFPNGTAYTIPAGSLCAFSNEIPIYTGPWGSFDSHGHFVNSTLSVSCSAKTQTWCIPVNGFTEFGVDLTAVLGLKSGTFPCISTALAKTRSSQSFTAELKDFAIPRPFNICGGHISIKPSAANQVNALHTFTVNVTQKTGGIEGPVPNGTPVTITLTPTLGATVNGTSTQVTTTCLTKIASSGPYTGQSVCSVTVYSNTTGLIEAHASATLFGSIKLQTDGTGGNSGDAFKRFVDARISIAPTRANPVGASHTFTVTVTQNKGDGAGFIAAPGTFPVVTITPSPVPGVSANTCSSPGTNSTGQCDVTFSSNTVGLFNGTAIVTFLITTPEGSVSVTRSTNGLSQNSLPAQKRFVDAIISIAPNAVNSIFEKHTFTVTVMVNIGSGFVAAVDGSSLTPSVKPVVTLTPILGATLIPISNTCTSGTDGSGQCTITFTSSTAGNVTGTATVTLTVVTVQGSATLTRSTDGSTTVSGAQNSGPAFKKFIAGSIPWEKVDNLNNPLGGATFQVCRVANFVSASNSFTAITPVCYSVGDKIDGNSVAGNDTNIAAGFFLITGMILGNYTIHETQAPPGFTPDPSTVTVSITVNNPTSTLVVFSDQRPILKLTGFTYNDTETTTPSQGTTVSGTVGYTILIHNFGTASGYLNFTFTVTFTGSGTFACTGNTGPATFSSTSTSCTLTAQNVQVLANGDVTFTLTASYTNAQSGAIVDAQLNNATYNTAPGDTFLRTVNGTPAEIKTTIQAN